MLWIALSLAFFWLALRELRSPWDREHPQPIEPLYLLLVKLTGSKTLGLLE